MRDWVSVLINIERASEWAAKNNPEFNEILCLAVRKIKESYGDAISVGQKEKSKKPVSVSFSSSGAQKNFDANSVDYSISARKIKGVVTCDLCKKNHIGCKKYFNNSGSGAVICGCCEAARLKIPLKDCVQEKSMDMMNYKVSGSYGAGKKK